MASSVLALTVATLLKSNAAASDASAAEKGLIKSKSGRKSAAADTGSGDEQCEVVPSASVPKPSAAREGEGAESSALQAPAAQRMSLLQRVLSRGKQQVVAPTTTPAEDDAVSVDAAGPDNVDADGPVADGSAIDASGLRQTTAALLPRHSNDKSGQGSAAVPATEEAGLNDFAPSGAASAGNTAAGGGGGSREAAAAVSGCPSGADAALTAADTAADAAPAGATCAGMDAGHDASVQTPVRADEEAAWDLPSQAAAAALPATVAAAQLDDAPPVAVRDGARAARVVAVHKPITSQSPPLQHAQRQPPLETVAASTAARLLPPPRIKQAAGRGQPRREQTQVHHAMCLIAPVFTV